MSHIARNSGAVRQIAVVMMILACGALGAPAVAQFCITSAQCPHGFGCLKPVGQCREVSTCVELPTGGCSGVYKPVCGCNGITYGNACEAEHAGWTVAYEGECDPDDFTCASSFDCVPGTYCQTPIGECLGAGHCASPPLGCPDHIDPVCGCDGNTYFNSCEAEAASVSILHKGECDFMPCNGIDTCPTGFYCEKAIGDCNGEGACRAKFPPHIPCPPVWMPVCGCDGNTYGSDCEAGHAGVSIAYEGKCNPTCAGDLTYNSAVGVPDLLVLLGAWGPCANCPADLTGDGNVGVPDLLVLLGNWGDCM